VLPSLPLATCHRLPRAMRLEIGRGVPHSKAPLGRRDAFARRVLECGGLTPLLGPRGQSLMPARSDSRDRRSSRRGQPLRCSGDSPEGVPPGARPHTACPVAGPWLRKAPPGTEPPLQQKRIEPVGTLRRVSLKADMDFYRRQQRSVRMSGLHLDRRKEGSVEIAFQVNRGFFANH